MAIGLLDGLKTNYRGFLSVFGAFLVQLTAGSYHGTFGNLLPYFSSYFKQNYPDITNGDLASVFSTGGLTQGVSFMLGGLIFVPLLGKRGCLVFGCVLFTLGPLLTYLTLDTNLAGITFSYGVLGASGARMVIVPTLLIPVTWFPEHKGKVIGLITSGYGFSSFVFSTLQTLMINPSNIPPVKEENTNSSSSYFESKEVLENLPTAFLYLGAIYAAMFSVGIVLTVEKPKGNTATDEPNLLERLRESFSYLFNQTFTRLDFYLLFLTRFLFLAVGCGILAHWKTFSFTQSTNDKLVSIVGGVNGVMNCLSQFVAGALLDRFRFNHLMPVIAALLTIILICIFFIGQTSFVGLIICTWSIYFLSFTHFSTVPVQTISSFKSVQNSVVVGCIGLAETFSYAFLGIINKFIMSRDDDPKMFLWLFISLAGCSFLAVFVTSMVLTEKTDEIDEKPDEVQESNF